MSAKGSSSRLEQKLSAGGGKLDRKPSSSNRSASNRSRTGNRVQAAAGRAARATRQANQDSRVRTEAVARHWRFGLGQGLTGTAAATGETIRVDDVDLDERYMRACPATRSELTVPLVSRDRVIGVVVLGWAVLKLAFRFFWPLAMFSEQISFYFVAGNLIAHLLICKFILCNFKTVFNSRRPRCRQGRSSGWSTSMKCFILHEIINNTSYSSY